MTFAAPIALVLLAAVPLAWWIHRMRRSAQVVQVASLAPFRTAPDATPSAAPRRAADVRLVLILSAMTLLALAAAGPKFGAARRAAFYVVTDRSVSMSARTCDAESRAVALLSASDSGAELVAHDLGGAGPADGLPESLALHLVAARDAGFPGIVVVTDSAVRVMEGVAVVGPSRGAATNLAVASAVLDGDEALVSIRNFATAEAAMAVVCAGETRRATAPPGGVAIVRLPAPASGAAAEFRIAGPADDLAADDSLRVIRRGGARRVTLMRWTHAPRLTAALEAAGVAIDGSGEFDVLVMYGMCPIEPTRHPILVLAPSGVISTGNRRAVVHLERGTDGGLVTGSAIAGRGEFRDILPAPGTTLRIAGYLTGGDPVWTEPRGVLAARADKLLVVAADPEAPDSDWHRDPSFPVFLAAALDELAGGPDRLVADGAVPASESDVVHEPPQTSSNGELLSVMRPADSSSERARPAPILALAGGLLLAAAAALKRR